MAASSLASAAPEAAGWMCRGCARSDTAGARAHVPQWREQVWGRMEVCACPVRIRRIDVWPFVFMYRGRLHIISTCGVSGRHHGS